MADHVHIPASRQLHVAVSIVTSAAADRGWGTGGRLTVRPGGRLQIDDDPQVVDAATVYQAARGLVGALLDDIAEMTGRDLAEVVGPWLVSLEMREALAGVDVDVDGAGHPS